MVFVVGIQDATVIGTSGKVTITSDLGVESSIVTSAIKAFEGVHVSTLSGFSTTWRTIGDVYYSGLRSIHVEEMPAWYAATHAATGANLSPYGDLGDNYWTGSVWDDQGTMKGTDTFYIELTSRGRPRTTNEIKQTIIHEILHESKLLDSDSKATTEKIISLVRSGDLVGPVTIDANKLRQIVEHAQIGMLTDQISVLAGFGRYDNRLFLTANLGYYLKYGIEIPGKLTAVQMKEIKALALEIESTGELPSSIFGSEGVVIPLFVSEDGNIQSYINEQGDSVRVTGSGDYSQLVHYATEKLLKDGEVVSGYSLGASFRILADALGFDGKWGIQGTFARPWEGAIGTPSGSEPLSAIDWLSSSQPSSAGTVATTYRGGPVDGSDNDDGIGNTDNDDDWDNSGGLYPIILDLNGNGVEITQFANSTQFMTGNDGLQHRSSWAGAGDGVLFYDPDGRNAITEQRQYVFTEWNPTASGDLEALRSIWDTNGDGKLSAADTEFAKFKVMVTNADGSTSVMTLSQLGITEIDLTANAVNIELPDGSVITGQTTFTRSNGTTGTVANTTLTADAAGYRVEESAVTNVAGERVLTQTGYAADGGVAFRVISATNPAGTASVRFYDDNGDGVTDRLQRIDKVTNGDGSKTETVANRVGADWATGILTSRTVTTTSADGKVITIERDSTGGGWFDQREVWTTNADGSRTEVIQELAQNGSVIHGRSETVSINGLTRTEGTDRDGNGTAETVESHAITIAGDNSRTEVTEIRNGDGSLRLGETEAVSADGKVRSVALDLDGDGDVDRTDLMSITGAAGSATTSVATVKNGDGSTRSVTTVVQAADALTKTASADVDGDGDVDLTTVDQTVIAGDGSRVRTVTATNTDGSVRSLVKETLGADKVTAETWVDQNQDGVFQTTDLVRQVTVDGVTQARTETSWARNPDGSIKAVSVAVTSADGLTTNTTVDADGDSDTDSAISDVTTVSGGVATRVVEVRNQDASLRSREVVVTSADGLTVTRTSDIDGNGTDDAKTVDARVLNGDGSVTRTVSDYAGNETTLTGRTIRVESADRREVTVTTDANGDGATDRVVSSVEANDGSTTVTDTSYYANGTAAAKSVTVTSANGLVSTVTRDANGDLVDETVVAITTVLNTDGSQVHTADVNNGDGSNRTLSVTTISDDGLVVTAQSDLDGDNLFDRTTVSTTVLNANGSATDTDQLRAQNNALLSQVQTTVSDDGLVTVTRSDADGDGDFDLTSTQTSTLLNDGGTSVVGEIRDLANVLRSKSSTATSDDGRSVTISEDVNGDGHTDRETTRVVANDGTLTQTVSEYSATGQLLSRERLVISDDGLTETRSWDRDGDGQYERRTEAVSVRNADGSVTQTTTGRGSNGDAYVASVVTTSDDGLTTTRSDDLDGDGTTDLTTVSTTSLAANGIGTETVEHRSEDNSLLDSLVVVTSADRRTVTENFDADGNGVNDRVSVTTIASNGQATTITDLLSTGGVLEARQTRTVSGDGLTETETVDHNGDGRVDLRTTSTTELGIDGTVAQDVTYASGRNVHLAEIERLTNDDGLAKMIRLDADGDHVFERRSEESTTFNTDGSTETVRQTFDGAGDLISKSTTQQSGNGLLATTWTEFAPYVASTLTIGGDERGTPVTTTTSGDSSDRVETVIRSADGGITEVTRTFAPGFDLQMEVSQSISADGRTRTMQADLDGDGMIDRDMLSVTDLGRAVTTIYRDLSQNGDTDQSITSVQSANGLTAISNYDVDGNGQTDFIRSRQIAYAADGSEVVTEEDAFGSGILGYRGVTTTSANGLLSVTEYDIDGDGTTDGTTTHDTALNADGSKAIKIFTQYANGDLRSEFVTSVSADGRRTLEHLDYDGNGIADKTVETTILADGSRVEVETAFDKGGMQGQVFTTITSADGLSTSIARSGNEQIIIRSALDNGTYTWDNGVKAAIGATNIVVRHQVDAFGVDTWVMTKTWQKKYTWHDDGPESMTRNESSTNTARIDAAGKTLLFEQAARLFDTILDRDLDFTEREQLVAYVENGQLNKSSLASSLLGSAEFSTRYGTMNNAEFITQIYLNTVGRAPTLLELDRALYALSATSGTPLSKTRAEIALDLSESSEHLLVGNGHLATNNFDVIINPAQFERSLDVAYTRALVEKLVDTVYDRDATEQELDYLSERLLSDVSNPDDLVGLLRDQSGDIQGVASATLKGLSGAALVEQAFINALGRQPTASEQVTWEQNLSSGYISIDQFIASLAMSVEKVGAGNGHIATVAPDQVQFIGTTGNDFLGLFIQQKSSLFIGAEGDDSIYGTTENDVYIWSVGDGSDIIYDYGTSSIGTDRLVLTDVVSDSITLARAPNTNDLQIKIIATGETITIQSQMASLTSGYGIEAIEFSDGVTWSLDDIKEKRKYVGGTGGDAAGAGNYIENLDGGAGNDTLTGSAGNDRLVGGTDADILKGAGGSDTYVWSRGDGSDTIDDNSVSTLDADRLVLNDVTSADVTLHDVATSKDIIVRIGGAGGADILIKDRGYEVGGVVQGRGIEVIEFSDGVVWTLEDIFYRGSLVGDSGNQNYAGTAYQDHYIGLGGQDTLAGLGGQDTLDGGTGNDSLVGGNGADTYVWRKGDGNDTINDSDTTTFETDVLVLEGVTSDKVTLTRANGSLHMTVTVAAIGAIPAETIMVLDKYNAASNANSGIEEIRFADGVIWTLDDIRSRTNVNGTGSAEVLSGTNFRDNLFGLDGVDTINAGANDDYLAGGQGADVLDGGAGNDYFLWSAGDGNDILSDTSTSTTEVDTLELTNVASNAATLTRSGADLLVTAGTETITVKNRFNTGADGRGVEMITFSDGVTMEVLSGPLGTIETTGTSAAQTLTGWAFSDVQYGLAGADILDAKAGNDSLFGGDGNDTLKGGDGSDTYIWSRGDDNDLIDDASQSRTETDTLVLSDVMSATDVVLTRAQGSVDLLLSIVGTTEVITIKNRFNAVSGAVSGYGVEEIVFGDGTVWTLENILANVRLQGGTGNDALSGTVYADNIYGGAGVDTITGGNGDDFIYGGAGADVLRGEGNSDTYVWATGDGNDTIDDNSSAFSTIDSLVLTNVLPGQVILTHASGSNNLVITIGSEVLTIANRFSNVANPYGIERIEFADGSVWDLNQILAATKMIGTNANESLTSNGYADNMFGLAGNDTLTGGDGDDALTGGAGNDSLVGGNGSDSHFWTKGEGNDTINDTGTSFGDVDRLVLTNVASTDVAAGTVSFTRASGSSTVLLAIVGTVTEVITLTNQMNSPTSAYGLEVVEFSDGVAWTMDDILANVKAIGTTAANSLAGTSFRDNLFGLAGNDTLSGANGHDHLYGGAGADSLNGGNGVDTASYIDAGQGVRVDLGVTTAQTGNAGGEEVGDILTGIEALEGSAYADILLGNAESNDLRGLAGNDSLSGKDGYDRLYGGEGADTLDGGIGVDLLTGGSGADRFVFTESAYGDDEIADFEDGIDVISFASAIADDFGDLAISGNGTSEITVAVGAHMITVRGLDPITLTADDFLFA